MAEKFIGSCMSARRIFFLVAGCVWLPCWGSLWSGVYFVLGCGGGSARWEVWEVGDVKRGWDTWRG